MHRCFTTLLSLTMGALLIVAPSLAVVAGGGAVFALATTAAEAGARLSERDLQQLFPGEFEAIVHGALIVSLTARAAGSLLAQFMGESDIGRWRIQSGKLCINLSKWLKDRTACSAVTHELG